MANIELKEPVVNEIQARLDRNQGAVLTDYRGLNVAQMTELRNKLREAGVEYKVVKNTLTRLAANKIGLEGLDPYLEGPTAIAFSDTDPVAPAKVLSEFAKANQALEIKAGLLGHKVIDMAGVKALAALPSREVLLAQVVGAFQAPLYGMANVLVGNLRGLVNVLDAVRKQKEAEA